MVNSRWFKGEGKTHIKAKKYVVKILRRLGYSTEEEHFEFYRKVNHENEYFRRGWGHYFDIYAVGHGYSYFIEIDGEIHSKPKQKNRDERAEDMLQELFGENYILVRIPKEVVLDCMRYKKPETVEMLFK